MCSNYRKIHLPGEILPGDGRLGLKCVSSRKIHRVGFLPWQKLFLPGQWKKTVKTVAKTSKNRQKLAKIKDTIN